MRKPLPPEILVDAKSDRFHREVILKRKARIKRAVKEITNEQESILKKLADY